ncbi:two-partner secretion domain-containing protein [Campylobacter sp. RM16704]|uniref:two-partner secretion domain-containing protein n=1 Tax=Campylobacter sp. RM16704 TaxID=1500960 RepID=UPI00058204DD|nr:filamentous hemagglutinin N-terminal domain-containing protein [Campylobacter sp. RM16704]AJC86906.1 hemagglutinin domain-containing protein [Campylobacter sp. RM16704]
MKTTKLTHHIILSGITVSLLFSPLMALPSGGKFTHGTTGTININGNTMNINGHKVSSVIQWGGGFSINQGESVNFNGSNKNYLNIAHGTSKSTIAGLLNANGNNVFLINPNGVIITKTGTINANRFVASTSSMDSAAMQNFANMNNFNDGLSFSPVFKPNKLGNVVNMGNIKADNITLQGNKVVLGSENYNNINKVMAKNIKLEGNEVYVDVASIDGNTLQGLNVDAKTKGNAYLNANGYYYNPYSFSVFSKISGNNNFKKDAYVGIGSDVDWWHFAKGWNENKAGFRTSASEYRLTKDIDFGGNNNKNYANYCIDGLGCTSMIVGYDAYNGFTKTFDGQGYTLKNINIDTTNNSYVGIFGVIDNATLKNLNVDYNQGSIIAKNDDKIIYAGGVAGVIMNTSKVENVNLKNINKIDARSKTHIAYIGGFSGIVVDWAGDLDKYYGKNCYEDGTCKIDGSSFKNIKVSNINSIYGSGDLAYIGGFTGTVWVGNYNYTHNGNVFNNIILQNIKNISAHTKTQRARAGGFAGMITNDTQIGFVGDRIDTYDNIVISGTDKIEAINEGTYDDPDFPGLFNDDSMAGGFAAYALGQNNFNNIVLNDIKNIHSNSKNKAESSYAAGFIGYSSGFTRDAQYSNIILNKMGSIIADGSGYWLGGTTRAAGFIGIDQENETFKNIYIFMNDSAKIQAKDDPSGGSNRAVTGFFHAAKKADSTYNNIHIYYKNGSINQSSSVANITDLTKHEYSNETSGYGSFKSDIQSKFGSGLHQDGDSFTFTTDFTIIQTPVYLPDINSIKNEQAQLDNDDLISNDIWDEYIIKDIDKVNYKINMRLLAKLLKEYPGIASKTENEQVKFMTSYLGVNETDARALLQSLSFLNAYKDNTTTGVNFKDNSVKTKFETSFNNAGNKVNVFNTNKNLWHNKLITLYNDTVKDGLLIEEQLLANQNKLDQAIKAYDNFVMLIKKGLKNENDPAFIIIKDNITKLNKEAKELYANLSVYKKDLKDFKTANNTTKVSVVGNFKDMLLVVPDVNKPISGGGDGEDPNKPDLPKTDLDFEQTASLNLIGDNTLEEESEKQEVEETALMQKGKICIVSDNFKTMNPCIVRSF